MWVTCGRSRKGQRTEEAGAEGPTGGALRAGQAGTLGRAVAGGDWDSKLTWFSLHPAFEANGALSPELGPALQGAW